MILEWYYTQMGEIIGPVSGTVLRQLARDGTITPDTYVRKTKDGKWITAAKIKALWQSDSSTSQLLDPRVPSRAKQDSIQNREHKHQPPREVPAAGSETRNPIRRWLFAGSLGLLILGIGIYFVLPKKKSTVSTAAQNGSTPKTEQFGDSVLPKKNSTLSTSSANGSDPKTEQFADIHSGISSLCGNYSHWSLAVEHEDKDYSLIVPSQVSAQLVDFERKTSMLDANSLYIKKHLAALVEFYDSLRNLGKADVMILGSKKDRPIPIDVRAKDGNSCLVLKDFASTSIYNTLRLTEKQRAARVIDTNVLPLLRKIDESLYRSDIPYYCIVYYYGSRDFSKELLSFNITPEVVAVIVSRDECHAFVSGSLSQERLLGKSEIFVGSNDKALRRVDIVIE